MIDTVTEALVDHLTRATADLGDWVLVSALHAEATPAPAKDHLHVCLYGVEEHGHLRNLPLEESQAGGLVRPPLFLRLAYVITYISDTPSEVQLRLARVIEVFHTTPILHAAELDLELADRVRTITIRLRSPSLDERNQLWTALGRPLLLSLYYEVDVAPVPVTEREGAGRIDTLQIEYEVT